MIFVHLPYLVLVIHHSNAEESMIRGSFRNRLSLNATLSSMLTVKLTNLEAVTAMLHMGASAEVIVEYNALDSNLPYSV